MSCTLRDLCTSMGSPSTTATAFTLYRTPLIRIVTCSRRHSKFETSFRLTCPSLIHGTCVPYLTRCGVFAVMVTKRVNMTETVYSPVSYIVFSFRRSICSPALVTTAS